VSAPARHLRVVESVVNENGELAGCPNCAEALAEAETWERRVLQLEKALERERADKDARLKADKDYTAAYDLFTEWATETGHPNAKFDTNRANLGIRAIRAYRKQRDALSMVIQYGKHFAYVDDRGVRHDSFGLLFRDAEHIEKYANAFARRRHTLGGQA
jgi:hypothetical protein